jgi:hypothetical protein
LIPNSSKNHGANPLVVAGDFNITTSKFNIEDSVKVRSISRETISMIDDLETMMYDMGMVDTWTIAGARVDAGEMEGRMIKIGSLEMGELNEGEEGATFDLRENLLTVDTIERGANTRPQRYDRVLVEGGDFIEVAGFNIFRFPEENSGEMAAVKSKIHTVLCGSDH